MKQKRISYSALGISSTPTISPKYWEKKKQQQLQWEKERKKGGE